MYAYVHFVDDGLKDTVSTKDIKGLNMADFNPHGLYWIRWKDTHEFFKGQILVVRESAKDITEFVAKSKRMRIPKVLDPTPPEEESTAPVKKGRKQAKDKMISQNSSIAGGKQMNLQAIPEERRKHSSDPGVLRDEATDSGRSDDQMVPKELLSKVQRENKALKRKLEKMQGKMNELREQIDNYQSLNVKLQKCLMTKILNPTSSAFLDGNRFPSDLTQHSQTGTSTVQARAHSTDICSARFFFPLVGITALDLTSCKDGSERKYMMKDEGSSDHRFSELEYLKPQQMEADRLRRNEQSWHNL
ncbi:uncharacterized protein [Trachinotus anak]|uniref:uncharacterized protein n=1 Tax=Trachinotus anak TaxID=443729 RepID=UPI0039F20374